MPPTTLEQIQHFFEHYKDLEPEFAVASEASLKIIASAVLFERHPFERTVR